MKVTLREYVNYGGKQVRHVDALRADFERRVVWLDPLRWVPFEAVQLCEVNDAREDIEKAIAGDYATDHTCHKCGSTFVTGQSLGGHKRHCKGRVNGVT